MLAIPNELLDMLLMVIIFIVVDLVLGIVLSIKGGVFDLDRFPDFLARSILPYIGGLLVLIVAVPYSIEMKALFVASAAATIAKFMNDIRIKVFTLFGKVPRQE